MTGSYDQLLKRYADYAPVYDRRWARYSAATLARSLEAVQWVAGSSPQLELLDVACGTGSFASMVRRELPQIRVTGSDVSADMLGKFRERFADDALASAHVAPAEKLPFHAGRFDILTCNNAFHLIGDAPAALREFHRVIKRGGHVIVVDWCRDYLTIKSLSAYLHLFGKHRRNIRTINEFTALVTDAGFVLEEHLRFRATPFWGMMRIVA